MDIYAIFQQINLRYEWALWVSAILTLNQMDVWMIFFFISSLSTSESRAKTPVPDSFECSSTPSEDSAILAYFSAIPCEPCSRYFFCYGEIFLPNMWGPLGCLLGFWPFGPKPCGGKNNLSKFIAPAGISPRGEIPRRHPSSSRVY